ncbi:hypothetical protein BDW22DRAFT_1345894 [Trametopsis cervina]|nr:hypothetical protein BDW22DRAFT_1345894 [Trametopsis cervina]
MITKQGWVGFLMEAIVVCVLFAQEICDHVSTGGVSDALAPWRDIEICVSWERVGGVLAVSTQSADECTADGPADVRGYDAPRLSATARESLKPPRNCAWHATWGFRICSAALNNQLGRHTRVTEIRYSTPMRFDNGFHERELDSGTKSQHALEPTNTGPCKCATCFGYERLSTKHSECNKSTELHDLI